MQPHIHCSIIYNSQDTETTKCPLTDDKEYVQSLSIDNIIWL